MLLLLILCVFLNTPVKAENTFNKYNLISPLSLASGGFVSAVYNDSFNIYNNPSFLAIRDYSYYELSFFKDSFDNYLFHLSAVSEKKRLSPYNFGIKLFYNDFSDDDIGYRVYGINPGISVKILNDLFGGVSFLLYKNSFENMDNLLFLSSFSFTYQLIQEGYASVYVKNLGGDVTYFGKYSDGIYPDFGFLYSQKFNFGLLAQGLVNYSEYNEVEGTLALLYDMKVSSISLLPLISVQYKEDFDLMNGLSYGMGLKTGSLMVEFGFKVIDSENLYSLSLKNISL